jgi:hypothetical protein
MTQSLYNKTTTCEIATVDCETKSISKKKDRQAKAGGLFGAGREADGTVYLYKHSLPVQELTTIANTNHDNFIENALKEYTTWLAQTEILQRQRALSTIEPFQTTDWSPLLNKEATTN